MTDKQIIIDGVDVAGCVRLQDDELSCDLGGECKGWENCYYKQLKRKEQECEELKKELMKKDEVNTFFNTPIEGWSNDPCGICELKQTIAEIKEIVEVEIECKTYEIENDCFNETRCKALNEHIDFIKQILQKISECEANNE